MTHSNLNGRGMFNNSYGDIERAESYAQLEFPNTYYLAYRDLPEIILSYKTKGEAIDFGCGTGRSTRFLDNLGFDTLGVDISPTMIEKAKSENPGGCYQIVEDGRLDKIKSGNFDLALSVFTFDNIPGIDKRIGLLKELNRVLKDDGVLIVLDSTPELYINEWASFSTRDFNRNFKAKSGDIVKVIMKDVPDKRPVDDVIWFPDDYHYAFRKSDFNLINSFKPLAKAEEPFIWVNETQIAPWIIYVLRKE